MFLASPDVIPSDTEVKKEIDKIVLGVQYFEDMTIEDYADLVRRSPEWQKIKELHKNMGEKPKPKIVTFDYWKHKKRKYAMTASDFQKIF